MPKGIKYTKETFIIRAKQIHGDKYDYSRVDYKRNDGEVCIVCPDHGEFFQTPNHHLLNHKCRSCSKNKPLTSEEFFMKCNAIHNNYYNYDKSVFVSTQKSIIVTCPIHNDFKQLAGNHYQGQGCPRCNISKGNLKIENVLDSMNIEFEREKMFKDCRGKRKPLLFDFYIPKINTCIEFDGPHHFHPDIHKFKKSTRYTETHYEKVKSYDEIKNKYCVSKGIKLIRIPYWDYQNIETILLILSNLSPDNP